MKRCITLLAIAAPCCLPLPAIGDGCILTRSASGIYVPETEQHAFIDWDDGHERLYVATHAEASSGGTLWLLPVPGEPSQIKAEPAKDFPRIPKFYPAASVGPTWQMRMYGPWQWTLTHAVCLPAAGAEGAEGAKQSRPAA